jgi:hypothetical protein
MSKREAALYSNVTNHKVLIGWSTCKRNRCETYKGKFELDNSAYETLKYIDIQIENFVGRCTTLGESRSSSLLGRIWQCRSSNKTNRSWWYSRIKIYWLRGIKLLNMTQIPATVLIMYAYIIVHLSAGNGMATPWPLVRKQTILTEATAACQRS